ncbi:DMT family transporter [Halomarina litorea]|uniref:DMT family transporter n=1 Tax=Halomarina litorea TaxID=2961595 RepID=UPI0020C53EC1|nr:DMT family transporter [Halomarina sp. BCD28]
MSRHRNLLLFLALAVMWGSAFVAIKAGLDYGFPPVLFAAVRYDVAGLLMLAYAFSVLDDPFPRTRRELADVAVSAVFIIAGYHALLFVGEGNTTSAAAAVIVSLSPVLTTAIARAVLPRERLSVLGVLGLLLGLVGVGLLVRPDPNDLLTADVVAKGLVFGAALSFALGSVLNRRIDSGIAIESLEAWSMLAGALLMHGLSLGLGESAAGLDLTPGLLASVAYLSLVASALGFLVYFRLLDRLGPIEINLVSYVAPIVAAVVGFALLGEVIDAATAGGFLVIVAGFVLIKWEAIRTEVRSLRTRGVPGDD